jgi:hypothetical protein
LALNGVDEEQIKEAGWAAHFTTGISTYLYSIGYSQETFRQELDRIIKHIQESAQGWPDLDQRRARAPVSHGRCAPVAP